MLALGELPPGSRVLDLGAGSGESLKLLRELGCEAVGIDLEPRSPLVARGDLLRPDFPDGSFDAVLSQCSFFVSGDQPGALRSAYRLLRPGGTLLLTDVFFEDPAELLRASGFTVLTVEDMTAQWREYYLEALWRSELPCCEIPHGKSTYWMLIGRKD